MTLYFSLEYVFAPSISIGFFCNFIYGNMQKLNCVFNDILFLLQLYITLNSNTKIEEKIIEKNMNSDSIWD